MAKDEKVKDFFVEVQKKSVSQALKDFSGKNTPAEVAAAQRIAKKVRRVKVPKNLLKKFWDLTGGWTELNKGWGGADESKVRKERLLLIGDLKVYFMDDNGSKLEYRGRPVAYINCYYYKDSSRLKALISSLKKPEPAPAPATPTT